MKIKKIPTDLEDLFLIEYEIFEDSRGAFVEIFNQKDFSDLALETNFVQDNISISKKGTLRGLHFQKNPYSQGKLIKVFSGKILDCVVDLRKDSKTYGQYQTFELSASDNKSLYVGRGFAHGFLALEENTTVLYKCDAFYNKSVEQSIKWNDKDLNITWDLEKYNIKAEELIISEKDKQGLAFNEVSLWRE